MILPVTWPALDLRDDAAGNVQLVPPGVHQNALGPRLQARAKVVDVPIPALLPDGIRPGILTIAEQVVTQAQGRHESR